MAELECGLMRKASKAGRGSQFGRVKIGESRAIFTKCHVPDKGSKLPQSDSANIPQGEYLINITLDSSQYPWEFINCFIKRIFGVFWPLIYPL